MRVLVALLAFLMLASCAGTAELPQSGAGAGTGVDAGVDAGAGGGGAAQSPFPTQTTPVYRDRAIPRDPLSGRPLVADYVIVDKTQRLLIAYSKGKPIRAYRGLQFGDAPQGHKRFEGDERTPEGLYTIDTRNPRSSFHLSLRISYPNAQDRAFARQYGRSPGGDIFIHGQPTGRPGRMRGDWTDGCIALSNAQIEELWQIVPDGTPIEIRP